MRIANVKSTKLLYIYIQTKLSCPTGTLQIRDTAGNLTENIIKVANIFGNTLCRVFTKEPVSIMPKILGKPSLNTIDSMDSQVA